MKVISLIRNCLGLLPPRDRFLLGLATFAQMVAGLLDLAGVALIGLVSLVSVSIVSNTPLSAQVERFVPLVGLSGREPVTVVLIISAVAGAALLLKSVLSVFLARLTFRFLAHRQANLSVTLTAALLTKPIAAIQQNASQDTAFVLTAGTGAAMTTVLGGASTAIADVSLLILMAAGLTAIEPVVTLFTVLYFGGMAFVMQRILSGWARRLGYASTALDISAYMLIQDAIESYREVTVLGRRSLFVSRMGAMQGRIASIAADSQFLNLIPRYVFEASLVVGALILALSQLQTRDAAQAVGVIAVFIVAASRVTPAMLRLQVAALSLRRAEAPAQKVLSLNRRLGGSGAQGPNTLDVQRMQVSVRTGHPGFVPTVKVTGISMSYDDNTTVALADVSFTAPAGSSVAFVGPTGAGKSTLADVLLGIAEPTAGEIQLGGLPPLDAVLKWPGAIAYVPQEVALMGGSVRENVALGLPRDLIDDGLVWEALERAHLADFLRSNRDGLDTVVGEDGMRLSGGQRQRLGVARALYTRPRLLVLDEATSALDAETEEALAETLCSLEGQVTTITIAHRLATVRRYDQVLYLEQGEVVGRGTFEEVRRQSKAFDRQATLLGL